MRRARLNVRPNIAIRGGRSVTAKPVVSAIEPVVTLNPASVTENETGATANDTVVTSIDPVVTVREPELLQSKEREELQLEPKLKVEEVVETEAVQNDTNNVEVKCSPRKQDTPVLSLGGSTGVNTVNVVRRRNRIKPPVLVTRKRTCAVDLERISSDKQSPRNDAGGRIPPVPQDNDQKIHALSQESKEKIHEPDKCQPAPPLSVAEDSVNVHVENLGSVDKKNAQDLVKLTPSSGDESKPLSSSKVGKAVGALRRSHFPKAKPNLVDTGRHVRVRPQSLSDAEEEAGKMQGPPSVQRVASLSASPANARLIEVVPDTRCSEVFVPPSCSNILPTDECSKTEDVVKTTASEDTLNKTLMSKSEKKQVLRRKRRKMETLAEGVDRSKLTMRDLIYMNPVDNPMKSTVEEAERRRKNKAEERVRKLEGENPKGDNPKEEKIDDAEDVVANGDDLDNEDHVIDLDDDTHSVAGTEKSDAAGVSETKGGEEEEDEETLVPQVTIGPDGNIVINKSSLTVETDKTKGKEQEDWDIVTEEFSSSAQAYGRKPPSRLWKLNETKKFYVALSTVGTDFSLMCNLFPKRSRVELKRKFKREEKSNKHLVDTALMERRGFDVTLFEELSSDENEETMTEKKKKAKELRKSEKENEAGPKRKGGKKDGQAQKKQKTKKNSKYYDDSSSESDAADGDTSLPEQNGVVVVALDNNDDDGDDNHVTIARAESSDEGEAEIMKGLCRTTRYGRKPRPVKTYEATATPNPRVKRIGTKPSDVIVASPGDVLSPVITSPSALVSPGRGMFARSPSGQLISLASLGQSSPIADIATSRFVFVTSPPKPNPDGSASSSEQVIHVYVVSNNANATLPGDDPSVLQSIEPPPSSETTSVLDGEAFVSLT